MFEPIKKFAPKRIYRIGISFIIFFIAINVCVATTLPSYKSTKRASEILIDDNICNFVEKDFDDIKTALRTDEKPKIFLLGDSISYGIGVEDESDAISGYLRALFPDYSVYNLSSCGSKPLDYYLWIKYLSGEDRSNENIYLIQYNYKWFNSDNGNLEDRVSQKRILYHFLDYLDDEIKEKIDFYPDSIDQIQSYLNKNIPVAANKTKILAEVFNEKSKEDFIKSLFYGKSPKKSIEYKQKNWREKDEMRSFNCKIAYSKTQWDEEKNFNYYMYLRTLDFIDSSDLNALVYLPAYNNELIKKCRNDVFDENVESFESEAATRGVDNFSYIQTLDDSYFLDDMHLSEEGNKLFAKEIAKKLNEII